MPVRRTRSKRIRRRPKILTNKRKKTIRRSRRSHKDKHKSKSHHSKEKSKPKTPPPPKLQSPPPPPKLQLQSPVENTITVLIPCAHEDSHLLVNLINILNQQSIMPKEVIISLSGTKHITAEKLKHIDDLLRVKFPFTLKILYRSDKFWASQNKNYAASIATGDILVVQDADDIPHYQRFEIIKYFFDKYDIVHLMHSFIFRHDGHVILSSNYKSIPFNKPYNISHIAFYHTKTQRHITTELPKTHGEIGVKKSVWDKFKWDNDRMTGEDTRFNRAVQAYYEKTYYIRPDLIIYNRVLQHF